MLYQIPGYHTSSEEGSLIVRTRNDMHIRTGVALVSHTRYRLILLLQLRTRYYINDWNMNGVSY